ncbi:MAG: hypothetical protein M1833_000874 [Piccolia ochrophora]|nr:MAG: hypothetical protein M1833_000874 [Piccolia ochrophora]
MEVGKDGDLRRTSSHNSTTSARSRHSETVRVKLKKHASHSSSIVVATPSDKSLTSFPSLSPDSPTTTDARASTQNHVAPPSASPTPQQSSSDAPLTLDSLTVSTPSVQQRSPLFDDAPVNGRQLLGALHHTTDDHIERLVARNGAVALVRQLAEDLAGRDAQISALSRRTEERERVLRKMLRECEVSNMDVEARLRRSEENMLAEDKSNGAKRALPPRKKSRGGKKVDGSIDEMMNEAMSESVGPEAEGGYQGLGLTIGKLEDQQATIRASENYIASDDDARSGKSGANQHRKSRGAVKGWKDYIWTKGTSRKTSRASSTVGDANDDRDAAAQKRGSSGGAGRRKGLQGDLFQPPELLSSHGIDAAQNLQPDVYNDQDFKDNEAQARKASNSVTSWALKLVAGNTQAKDESKGTRDRRSTNASETPSGSRRSSITSSKTLPTAKAALTKVNSALSQNPRPTRVSTGPTGTVKGPSSSRLSTLASSPQDSDSVKSAINSGPVEMDTILPPDAQPPTITQTYNDHDQTDGKTDRFGFIYDQRRRKQAWDATEHDNGSADGNTRQEMLSPVRDGFGLSSEDEGEISSVKESLSSPADSRPETPHSEEGKAQERPTRRWQDYLKVATFPTELLSHTPSAGAMTTLATAEADPNPRPLHIMVANRGSLPPATLNPKPSMSNIHAESATSRKLGGQTSSTATPGKPEPEPVKILLDQLTELHDSLQRDRTVKWNEFLRKVRAERKKESEHAAATDGRSHSALMPEVALTDGEIIGVAGLGNKGKVGRAKWNEFKHLVHGGIPVSYRAKIWAECSGASALRVPGYYDDLLKHGVDDPVVTSQIAMDIHRTLTDNIFFRKGPGVAKLNEVLIAYARRNPEVGYCQGMNLITASLLLIMPTAEEAFWLLTSIVENILPPTYYDHSLLASRADQQVLRHYVTDNLPKLSEHLDALGIELEALTFQWFLSLFTDCLSAEALFRVWDVVLCTNDGSTFLFQVALALLKLNERRLLACRSPAGVYAYINHQMTNHAISIDALVQASEALGKVVRRDEVEERRARVLEVEKEILRERSERATTKAKGAGAGAAGTEAEANAKPASIAKVPRTEAEELRLHEPIPIDEDVEHERA